ncbi:hypothetical protein [Vibrio sp. 10N.247.310.17]|uniref:hypothetical protein n=1 Tax=Vibrio sp. 10N.247.310.17 TaxID=3229979 RepID=UPI0035546503
MDKSVKIGIATGIVASMVFVYCLDPILRIFGNTVVYLSSYVVSGLLDSLYAKSALGVAKDSALSVYSLLIGGITGSFFALLAVAYKLRQRVETGQNGDLKVKRKPPLGALIFLTFTSVTFMLYNLWITFFQIQVVTSFDQHIRIVRPYIQEHEVDLLQSEFAQMHGENDYLVIQNKLEYIAAENQLLLPDNQVYSMWAL